MGDMVRLCLQLPLPSNFPGHVLSEVRTLELINELLKTFAGPVFQPANVLLTSRRRELLFDPSDVFEDLPVYTDQSHSALVFPSRLLFARGKTPGEAPFANADDNAMEVSPQLSTISVLDRLLEPYLTEGYPHIELAASLMGCSVRSLQRRLKEESASYSMLVDRVRSRAAMRITRNART
jgi:AraC-like DNA-binding protein